MAVQQEPLRAFRFLVELEGGTAAAFTQFSGIRVRMDTINVRTGAGTRQKVPGVPTFENVTLTKGVIGSNAFLDWLFAAIPSSSSAPDAVIRRQNINIVALDDKGNRSMTWTLENAIPVAYELQPMSSSESTVLTEQIEFAIGGVKRQPS